MRRSVAFVLAAADRLALAVFALALIACGKHAPPDPPPPPLDRSTIYPLIVPANELPTGPVRRPLIEGLVVTLAADAHGAGQPAGQAKLLREVDLQGFPLDDAYTTALANLEAAAKRGAIQVHGEVGSDGHTVDVRWGHDWRAAACLLLPGVRQQATFALFGANPPETLLRAATPNRDALVLFADPAAAAAALAAEKGAPRPISNRVLRVLPTNRPFWIEPPVAWEN